MGYDFAPADADTASITTTWARSRSVSPIKCSQWNELHTWTQPNGTMVTFAQETTISIEDTTKRLIRQNAKLPGSEIAIVTETANRMYACGGAKTLSSPF